MIKKIFIISIMLGSVYSCFDHQEVIEKQGNDYSVKILIRKPGNCARIITFDEKGKGSIIKGLTDDYYIDSFTNFQKIQTQTNFIIKESDDLSQITNLVNEIENAKPVARGFKNDASRIELYINNKLKLETFGFFNKSKTDEILSILSKYVSDNFDEPC